MILLRMLLVVVPLLFLPLAAESGAAVPVTWTVSWGSGDGPSFAFDEASDEVEIRGVAEYLPTLRIRGVYRTRQAIDARAKLSFHLENDRGQPLLFEGPRSDWRSVEGGWREADFEIEDDSFRQTPGLRPGVRVQFDYVVENEFWQSRKHPETFLPVVDFLPPPRPAFFRVRWSWAPPIFPAREQCWFPAWIEASYGLEPPPPYLASPDLFTPDGSVRVDSPRRRLGWEGDGRGWVRYRFEDIAPQSLMLRPGFVWEGKEWFAGYEANPFRRVWVLEPLWYLAVLLGALLLVHLAAAGVAKIRHAGVRRIGWVLVGAAYGYLFMVSAVSMYGVIVIALAVLLRVLDGVREPGARLYWTIWGLLLLLDLFCLHVHVEALFQWEGTALSAALAGLVLLPLRLVRRRKWALSIGVVLICVLVLLATAMMVYRDFFGDYPGLSDLLSAGQVGDVGDSIWQLIEQKQLIPGFLGLCALLGLFRR